MTNTLTNLQLPNLLLDKIWVLQFSLKLLEKKLAYQTNFLQGGKLKNATLRTVQQGPSWIILFLNLSTKSLKKTWKCQTIFRFFLPILLVTARSQKINFLSLERHFCFCIDCYDLELMLRLCQFKKKSHRQGRKKYPQISLHKVQTFF